MVRKLAFGLVWVGFIAYAVGLAPPDQPETLDLIRRLSTGQVDGINPLIVALFNLMGLWPLIYSSLMLADGRSQKLPAWIFALASFAIGAFAILPYLALRQPNPTFTGSKSRLLKVLDSRWLGVGLFLASSGLLVYGFSQGDWPQFVQQWQTSRFIHVMGLDFCLLCLLFPALLADDMSRRGLGHLHPGSQQVNRPIFWAVSLAPLLGPVAYLVLRPPLPDGEPGLEACETLVKQL